MENEVLEKTADEVTDTNVVDLTDLPINIETDAQNEENIVFENDSDKINKVEEKEIPLDITENKSDIEVKEIKYDEIIHQINTEKDIVQVNERPTSLFSDGSAEPVHPLNIEDREIWFRSHDSSYVQESPEGDDILKRLFENVLIKKSEEHSRYSFTEKEHHEESIEISDPIIRRMELIEKLREANNERKGLVTENQFYQAKLVEYFRKVKVKEVQNAKQSSEKESLMDFSTQFLRYSEILQGLMTDLDNSKSKYNEKINKMKSICMTKNEQVKECTSQFHKYQESVGLSSLHSRTGNKLDPSIIRDYLQTEMKKEIVIKEVRLSNLKIEHKNESLDKALRSKENFESGLRLIDFEQLKIENQTFNEKVEDREESINNLNKKITKCNHLLSHIKEKISITEYDKKSSRVMSKRIDRDFKQLQKKSNKVKKVRDHIKFNNKHLQISCGLLGKKDYLRCYEDVSENTDILRDKIAKMEHDNSIILSKNRKLMQNINQDKTKNK